MRFYSLFLTVVYCASNMLAQSSRVASITTYNGQGEAKNKVSFSYDANNRITNVEYQSLRKNSSHNMTFTNEDSKITIDNNDSGQHDISRTIVNFSQGKIISSEVYGVKADGVTPYYAEPITYVYDYNSEGQMIQMKRTDQSHDYTTDITWGGGLVLNRLRTSSYDCTLEYSDIDNPVSNPFCFEFLEGNNYPEFDLAEPLYYFPQYFGKRPHKLVSTITVNKSRKRVYTYEYILDTKGNITEVRVLEDGEDDALLQIEYETTSGISETGIKPQTSQRIYNLNGVQTQKISKGINIVRMHNGQTKKIAK